MNIRSRRGGFSLVELLTVIAIIAILAGIIFPVMGAVKERARQNQCMTNLKNIGMGLEMFKTDNRRYPEVLGAHGGASGAAFDDASDPNGLFREYVKSPDIFRCPSDRYQDDDSTATYNKYTYQDTPDVTVFVYNSYEVQLKSSGGTVTAVPHYTLGWGEKDGSGGYRFVDHSDNPLPADPSTAGDDPAKVAEEDYSRQLRFRNPPDSTVVTWCSNHEKPTPDGGEPKGDALVLFKGGNVQAIPAATVESCKWRTRPKG